MSSMLPAVVVTLLVLASAWGVRITRQAANEQLRATQSYEDVYYLPPSSWLPVLSLHYRAALADLLWTRALVYFGEELAHRGAVAHVFDYADAILVLDPDFKEAYRWVGTAAIYRPTDVTAEDVERAAGYLERAVKRWPDDGQLAWDLGATLRFELPPLLKDDPKAANDARLRGAEHLVTAARLGAGPAWLPLTTAATFERQGRTEQAIRHLEEMYASVSDAATKVRIQERLAALQSQAYADNLRAALEAAEAERRANYPYMPPGLFLVVGPKPEAAWLKALVRGYHPPDEADSLAPGAAPAP